jgi:hypothetical protein
MCDTTDSPKPRDSRKLRPGFCYKCKLVVPNASVRNAHFCKSCLLTQTTQKFRSNLFKSGIKQEKALIALSGGPSSTCLLHLVKELENGRAGQFVSYHVCNISEYDLETNREDIIKLPFPKDTNVELKPFFILNSLIKQAELLNCTCIILGDNQTYLATKTIAHTSKGRGNSFII